jgi:acetolactate synthase-1/3 small subunit
VDVAKESMMVELAGTEQKIEAFIELMKPYGIRELARTGIIAMMRGMQASKESERSASPTGGKRKRSLDAPSSASLPPS